MDDETRKAFDNVMLGICTIEGMIAKLMLNEAIKDGDEERIETIKGMMEQMKRQALLLRERCRGLCAQTDKLDGGRFCGMR